MKLSVSRPRFLQINVSTEKAVDIAKKYFKKYLNLGLLSYRNGPLESGLSPAERLCGRKLRITIPSVINHKQVSKNEI